MPSSLCGFSSALLARFEGVDVRPVRQHRVVQRHAAGHEAAAGLGVVDAVDEPHELAHHVHMVPGRAKRILRHQPAVAEDHEIDVRRAGRLARRGQHGEDAGVGVIVKDRADGREASQVVFVGRVVAVPGHDVQRRARNVGHATARRPI